MPRVSIITPTFNSARTIQKSLDSILAQTYKDIELIVVDALSDDATLQILDSYSDIVSFFISEPDVGMYDAINKGIKISTGEYILILNSDDWYYPKAIEVLLDTASNHHKKTVVAALAHEYTEQRRAFIRAIPLRPWDYSAHLRMPLRHELMLIPAFIYSEQDCYDISYKLAGDLDFCSRLKLNDSIDVVQIDKYLMGFRAGGMGYKLTSKLINERKENYKKVFGSLPEGFLEILACDNSATQLYDHLLTITFNNISNGRNLVLACRDYLGHRGFYQDQRNQPKWKYLTNWSEKLAK